MFDRLLLKMAKSKDATGQDGPEFGFCEVPFLDVSFADFVVEGSLWVLEEGEDFIEG